MNKGHIDKDQVIAKLREHEPELKAAGILRLAVFGSVARGDNSAGSDVDLLADFDKTQHFTLLTVGRAGEPPCGYARNAGGICAHPMVEGIHQDMVLREAVDAF